MRLSLCERRIVEEYFTGHGKKTGNGIGQAIQDLYR